jgi:hypothetical protein
LLLGSNSSHDWAGEGRKQQGESRQQEAGLGEKPGRQQQRAASPQRQVGQQRLFTMLIIMFMIMQSGRGPVQ